MSDVTSEYRKGLTNKELLIRVLDEISVINTKLDAKADRTELQVGIKAVQDEALATKAAVNQDVGELRELTRKKVSRGEMFGWLSFAAGIVSVVVGVII